MSKKVRVGGELVRTFLLNAISRGQADVVAKAAEKFEISRQAIHAHIKKLEDAEAINVKRGGRRLSYTLRSEQAFSSSYNLSTNLDEGDVWEQDIRPLLESLPGNVLNIWHHGFTEMFNNAMDHSQGTSITVQVRKSAVKTQIVIEDDGVGIFQKIQQELGLVDPRLAIFELSKGKLTTDPARHSGEGIFFTSRMMEHFSIRSRQLEFVHDHTEPMDILDDHLGIVDGTQVIMELKNHTSRTTKKVFDQFTTDKEEYAFDKTIVPMRLAVLGTDQLVSRSQAKRTLARVEKFRYVVLDFKGVSEIGQAFADEIFRVYAKTHPEIIIAPINESKAVAAMINRARSA
ncbi:MAG: DUF4325 domain-containing protein [Simplicispira sp.]|nr:DUF4325 domain-containing protein [Simplicispira sp.]